MKIAVISTLYNGDSIKYAQQAIDSILSQSIDSCNINIYIHVDGQLDDEHKQFIKANINILAAVIYSNRNIGLAKGLNKLINLIENEKYVFRMDLDDICHPDRFIQQIEFMENNIDIDLCGCNAAEIDQHGKEIYHRKYPESHNEIIRANCKMMPILHPTFCFRASSIKKTAMEYPDAYLTEDLALFFTLIDKGWRFHNIQNELFYWRRDPKFYERRNLKRSFIEVKTYIFGLLKTKGPTFQIIYPIVRFIFRLTPSSFAKWVYNSGLRNRMR